MKRLLIILTLALTLGSCTPEFYCKHCPTTTTVTILNFTGAGATASGGGATATINIPGGAGSFSITEAEIDFGSKPTEAMEFTVTDAAITGTSKIMVTPSGNVATSRVGNDYSWENFTFSATAETGTFVTATTHAPRVVPLGHSSFGPTAAAVAGTACTPINVQFRVPIVVRPGENVAIVLKLGVGGVVTTTGAVTFMVNYDSVWE